MDRDNLSDVVLSQRATIRYCLKLLEADDMPLEHAVRSIVSERNRIREKLLAAEESLAERSADIRSPASQRDAAIARAEKAETIIAWLEREANKPGGILLHSEKQPTGRIGLGLANTGRTLAQAVTQAMGTFNIQAGASHGDLEGGAS